MIFIPSMWSQRSALLESKQLSPCLLFVNSWQTRIPVKPEEIVMFFSLTAELKVHLYIHSVFLGLAEGWGGGIVQQL